MVGSRALIHAILAGGLIGGALDIAYAILANLSRAAPGRVLQSVAAGLLGKSAFQGGAPTAALGLLLHFAIATVMAAAFVLAATRITELVRRPWLWGPLYGIGLYLVMNFIVRPLSANPPKGPPPITLTSFGDVLSHMFFVGLVIALFARRALAPPP